MESRWVPRVSEGTGGGRRWARKLRVEKKRRKMRTEEKSSDSLFVTHSLRSEV